jgi:nicotinamidase-related amidase
MRGTSLTGVSKTDFPSTLTEFVDPASTALLMWDMQVGLAGKASNRAELVGPAGRLVASADAAGVPVFWSRHILPPRDLMVDPTLLFLMRKQKVDHPDKLSPFMLRGAPETAFLPGFEPAAHHSVIEKSLPSMFVDTPFDSQLRALGIRTLVLAGVATDIGIEFTARHAAALGYFAVVADDATGSYTPEAHARSLKFLEAWAVVAPSASVCGVWDAASSLGQHRRAREWRRADA